jgi:glutathione S-transferase
MTDQPILWSFRRCPYAMRARLAILTAGVTVEIREILLRDKPTEFLATSPSGTVPCLRTADTVYDESLDIMIWALEQRDPSGLLDMPEVGWALIKANDGPFKAALDHTKYITRYPDLDLETEREKASAHLRTLDSQLSGHNFLFGDKMTIADLAILPFIRQFAHIDRAWFDAQNWTNLRAHLDRFLASDLFARVMEKRKPWAVGDEPTYFG